MDNAEEILTELGERYDRLMRYTRRLEDGVRKLNASTSLLGEVPRATLHPPVRVLDSKEPPPEETRARRRWDD